MRQLFGDANASSEEVVRPQLLHQRSLGAPGYLIACAVNSTSPSSVNGLKVQYPAVEERPGTLFTQAAAYKFRAVFRRDEQDPFMV
jgi:hypothetical protein